MSLCINDDLIWISIPKCASFSVESALINSKLQIKFLKRYKEFIKKRKNTDLSKHAHYSLKELYNEFGILETFCITRDDTERFISGLNHTLWMYEKTFGYTPIIRHNELNNNFIFNNIDEEFINNLNSDIKEDNIKCVQKLLKNKLTDNDDIERLAALIWILKPQNFWKDNRKCNYEFSIHNLNELENFIFNRYNIKIKIPILNRMEKNSFIVYTDELKNYCENILNKNFQIKKTLI